MDLVSLLTSTTSKGNPNLWNVSKGVFDAGADAWDISKAYSATSFLVQTQESSPTGLFFKPDGTKMYVTGTSGDDVNEYTLSIPFAVNTSTYVQNFSVSAQETSPQDVFFKPDGTVMYIVGGSGQDINEYSLSSAWDISTASYDQNFSVSATASSPKAVFFKPDGTKMYVVDGSFSVYEYDLSSAWDVSTASYVQNFSTLSEETDPKGISFKPDGTKMFIYGNSADINEYSLSSEWDISTASFSQAFYFGTEGSPEGFYFRENGTAFYVVGTSSDRVYQINIGGFSVAAQDTEPTGIFLKPDGTKMYVTGNSSDSVYEYDLSTPYDISTASYVQGFSLIQDATPTDLFFKPDGTKFFCVGASGDAVLEYTLSSAWDISTLSYVDSFTVSSQDTVPTGLFFRPDGTKMYVVGATNDSVYEYDLSSAWDVSTASYVQSFSVATEETDPRAVFFKPDGTKMYVLGNSGNDINEYSLSSAWDISTASYLQNLNVSEREGIPEGLFWKDDGTQFWGVGSNRDRVFSYLISPT